MMFIDRIRKRVALIKGHSAVIVERDLPLDLALAVDIGRVIVQVRPLSIILRLVSDSLLQNTGYSNIAGVNRNGRFRRLAAAVIGNDFTSAVVLNAVVRCPLCRNGDPRHRCIAVQICLDGIRDRLAVDKISVIFDMALDIKCQNCLLRQVDTGVVVQGKENRVSCRRDSRDAHAAQPGIPCRKHIVCVRIMINCCNTTIIIAMRACIVIIRCNPGKFQLCRQKIC